MIHLRGLSISYDLVYVLFYSHGVVFYHTIMMLCNSQTLKKRLIFECVYYIC